jgi:hypothetical protein
MANENMQSAEDEYIVIEGYKIDRKTHCVEGCYKDNVFIPEKDMSAEDRHRAYGVMLRHTFDLRMQ